MFSVLLNVYLGMELLDHEVTLFNPLRNCLPDCFQSGHTNAYSFLPAMYESFSFSTKSFSFQIFFVMPDLHENICFKTK